MTDASPAAGIWGGKLAMHRLVRSSLALICTLSLLSSTVVPVASNAVWLGRIALNSADAAIITSYRLRNLKADDVEGLIFDALEGGDLELARSYAALAEIKGFLIDPALLARLEPGFIEQAGNYANMAVSVFSCQAPETMEAIVLSIGADFTFVGDGRDLWCEGGKLARGEDYDALLLGIGVVGVAITGATWVSTAASIASGGTAAPAAITTGFWRYGLSSLKLAAKAKVISRPLAQELTAVITKTVDFRALGKASSEINWVDPASSSEAFAKVINRAPLDRLLRISDDVGVLAKNGGVRTSLEGMRVAETAEGPTALRKVADRYGTPTFVALKIVGKGALTLTGLLWSTLAWLVAVIAWVKGAVGSIWLFWRTVKQMIAYIRKSAQPRAAA